MKKTLIVALIAITGLYIYKPIHEKHIALDSLLANSIKHEASDNKFDEKACWDSNKMMIGYIAANGVDIGQVGFQRCVDEAHTRNHHLWIEVHYKGWAAQIANGNLAWVQWMNSGL